MSLIRDYEDKNDPRSKQLNSKPPKIRAVPPQEQLQEMGLPVETEPPLPSQTNSVLSTPTPAPTEEPLQEPAQGINTTLNSSLIEKPPPKGLDASLNASLVEDASQTGTATQEPLLPQGITTDGFTVPELGNLPGATTQSVLSQFNLEAADELLRRNQAQQEAYNEGQLIQSHFPTLYDTTGKGLRDIKNYATQSNRFLEALGADYLSQQELINQQFSLTPPAQDRTDPKQFRPDSTKSINQEWDEALNGVAKKTEERQGDYIDPSEGLLSTIFYGLNLPSNAVKGALLDAQKLYLQTPFGQLFYKNSLAAQGLARIGLKLPMADTEYKDSYFKNALAGRQFNFVGYEYNQKGQYEPLSIAKGKDPTKEGDIKGQIENFGKDPRLAVGFVLEGVLDPLDSLFAGARRLGQRAGWIKKAAPKKVPTPKPKAPLRSLEPLREPNPAKNGLANLSERVQLEGVRAGEPQVRVVKQKPVTLEPSRPTVSVPPVKVKPKTKTIPPTLHIGGVELPPAKGKVSLLTDTGEVVKGNPTLTANSRKVAATLGKEIEVPAIKVNESIELPALKNDVDLKALTVLDETKVVPTSQLRQEVQASVVRETAELRRLEAKPNIDPARKVAQQTRVAAARQILDSLPENTPAPKVRSIPSVVLRGEVKLSELADLVADNVPGTQINAKVITAPRMTKEQSLELMKVVPAPDGKPIVSRSLDKVESWTQVRQLLADRGIDDPVYFRIFSKDNVGVDVEALKAPALRVVLDEESPFKAAREVILENPAFNEAGISQSVGGLRERVARNELKFNTPDSAQGELRRVKVADLEEAVIESQRIGVDGKGGNQSKYDGAVEFLSNNDRALMPEVAVDGNGRVTFIDGKHRFAALRDSGVEEIPVNMIGAKNWDNWRKPRELKLADLEARKVELTRKLKTATDDDAEVLLKELGDVEAQLQKPDLSNTKVREELNKNYFPADLQANNPRATELQTKHFELKARLLDVSEEVQDLEKQMLRQKEALVETLHRADATANIGRPEAIEFSTPTAAIKPARRVVSEIDPEINSKTWYHGTSRPNWKPDFNPLDTPAHEWGQGLYLSVDDRAAANNAKAVTNVESFEGNSPAVYELKANTQAPLNVDEIASKEVRQAFRNALTAAFPNEAVSKEFAQIISRNEKLTSKQLFGVVERVLVKEGIEDTEAAAQALRKVNENLLDLGYDALHDDSTLKVLDMSKVEVINARQLGETNAIEAMTARYNADSLTAKANPDIPSAHVNHLESSAKLQAQLLEETERKLEAARQTQIEVLSDLENTDDSLKELARAEKAETAQRQARQLEADVDSNTQRLANNLDDPCSI
ncbi:hypothetical protein BZZ01_13540 [Nostocales cyanobacterium HT-58-2]|nr:hypothetical protein BZZ01_13540 [Nostocales cyanobacterium HT-58-2]